jgi:hypothetical protein
VADFYHNTIKEQLDEKDKYDYQNGGGFLPNRSAGILRTGQ